jgi:hypothetical protein
MKKFRGVQFLPKNSTYDRMTSPIGDLTIITSRQGLHTILWDNDFRISQYEKVINNLIRSPRESTILKTIIRIFPRKKERV